MIGNFITKMFGSTHDRRIKKIQPMVDKINEIFESYKDLPEEEFLKNTDKFRERLANGETVDDLLPEAYATVKEAARRLQGTTLNLLGTKVEWNMVHFDVQIIGGIVLHQNSIAEMATGEGKTLVSTLPIYLNALTGKGVHVITVNDYLAERDSVWMGHLYKYLGLTVGVILNNMQSKKRQEMYGCDITYGTNNEFGFDYLRDNMSSDVSELVQRDHYFAIIDEVDSVLIDEARTPLIISGPVSESTHQYDKMQPYVKRVVDKQRDHVASILKEAEEKLTADPNDYEGARLLLIVKRGAPKNKKLMKLLNQDGFIKQVQTVESDYIREKKLHVIDEELYFAIDEKSNSVDLSDMGHKFMSPDDPDYFILDDYGTVLNEIDDNSLLSAIEKIQKKEEFQEKYAEKSERLHNIHQLLKAYMLFEKDVDYVIQEGLVQIVDEHTGRIMEGRRYSDGLHQALEAKEGVKIERETQTMATITLQNYFRMYDKLAGMTGTAETEALEFFEIYKLETIVIPTNRQIARDDRNDLIYRTKREKYTAVLDKIVELNKKGQPILVGTTSVDESELISRMLTRTGIKHNVLNAKQHAKEADVVADAGKKGAVTIATNMAGRGTDIKLGQGVIDLGGLFVIGTGRNEARRIDRQLRGRSGRQGDVGASEFFLSLEDELLRLFGLDRMSNIMDRLGVEEGEVITHSLVTKQIERAQKNVETQNFSIRKRLIEYDNVMNLQRNVIYDRRRYALKNDEVNKHILEILNQFIETTVDNYSEGGKGIAAGWMLDEIMTTFADVLLVSLDKTELETLKRDEFIKQIKAEAERVINLKIDLVSKERFEKFQRFVILSVTDEYWKDHLYEMDALKENTQIEAMGKQKDPLLIYKSAAYDKFQMLLDSMDEQILRLIWHVKIETETEYQAKQANYVESHREIDQYQNPAETDMTRAAQRQKPKTVVREEPKVGRNDPCPCGSGKKYKNCHGKN
jgi:preprotein translocase subunit SecA